MSPDIEAAHTLLQEQKASFPENVLVKTFSPKSCHNNDSVSLLSAPGVGGSSTIHGQIQQKDGNPLTRNNRSFIINV